MKLKLLAVFASVFLLTSTLLFVFRSPYTRPSSSIEYARTSVMITNKELTSGGTGVILRSGDTESMVLTNRHVCRVIATGGIVSRDDNKYLVKEYMESKEHDLCLIKVAANLGISTAVAKYPPGFFTEAHISGHPHLLPNVVSHGDFSGKMTIDVMSGVRQCTEAEVKDPATALLCLFLGGIPIVETFQSQVVTALIMPGSSGSAVFNSYGEISGLAFAGSSRDFSYAFIVPQEYVRHFVEVESGLLSWKLAKEDDSGQEGKIVGVSREKLELYLLIRSLLKMLLGNGADKYLKLDITTLNTSALWVKER